jgi:predicted lipoprotein
MHRLVLSAVFVAVAAAVMWRFPLFHVIDLSDEGMKSQPAEFDADKIAADLWAERLTPAMAEAPDARTVLAALAEDTDAARQKFGRTVGMSRATMFFVRGQGRIVAIEKSRVGVAFDAEEDGPDLWLATGPVFGNAVRDASGLVLSQDFPNSQNFNALATVLNKLAEDRVVLPLGKSAAVDQRIDFVAVLELPGGVVRQPLELIPIAAMVE